jgi:hypothetical protein
VAVFSRAALWLSVLAEFFRPMAVNSPEKLSGHSEERRVIGAADKDLRCPPPAGTYMSIGMMVYCRSAYVNRVLAEYAGFF